ncbi:virulence factor Mce family protein [Mycobacterium sp. CVI_P3]|uniref:Virulence factor Mce family protein n=1 Tax=Mycobacterium pinniadriaticum TaxID=2994102 RepID=A0ABT3SNS0_9MYCO|nr:virulence factor Mce family protein [Mycobacterium pinniadriaticum]MCX2934752.1 virulence factor Mce family protein [Mycobacterium pinniadriaticum]MCX2941174.1 virulence factor Mce family protein [Mycobacterium pinniadriaticum]
MRMRIETPKARIALAITMAVVLVCGIVLVARATEHAERARVTAYFDNSNGVFPGDDVLMLGIPIGRIDTIEPQPTRAKITFWFDAKYKVPADAKAVILSPQLVTARAIQLTPVYTGGPVMTSGAVIPQDRTAVPVEWDDFRQQLEKLSSSLQPGPDGVSPFGAFINSTADNLRGQGAKIRDTVIKLSQVFSTLGDHSNDIFSTIKNLSVLVSALHSSTDLMQALNSNLASVTALLADDPDAIGQAIDGLNTAAGDVSAFIADNRESLGTTSDKLASISKAMVDSIDDIKQMLHVAPPAFANFINIYEPAHGSFTGALAVNNFANPISFLCGAIQAASRLGNEQAAKLCVQYLAPIVKNRQFNFPPIGVNPFVGAEARPNEVTYSEDWMRPDYRPAAIPGDTPPAAAPLPNTPPLGNDGHPAAADAPALPAEAGEATDPGKGLAGMMAPPGAGS